MHCNLPLPPFFPQVHEYVRKRLREADDTVADDPGDRVEQEELLRPPPAKQAKFDIDSEFDAWAAAPTVVENRDELSVYLAEAPHTVTVAEVLDYWKNEVGIQISQNL